MEDFLDEAHVAAIVFADSTTDGRTPKDPFHWKDEALWLVRLN